MGFQNKQEFDDQFDTTEEMMRQDISAPEETVTRIQAGTHRPQDQDHMEVDTSKVPGQPGSDS